MTSTDELRTEIESLRAALAASERERDQLAEENRLFNILMETSPFYIFFRDRKSHFIMTSRSHAEAIFNTEDRASLVGKTDFDLFPQEDAQRFFDEEQQIMASGEPVIDREWSVPAADGSIEWLTEYKLPIRDESGAVIGLVGYSYDITDRKEAEIALQHAYTEIEAIVAERTTQLEAESAKRTRLQAEIIDAQQAALQELTTPIIPVLDGLIIVPLIGSLDDERARETLRALLAGINHYNAQVVILDITGMPLVDTSAAGYMDKAVQAARLKGAQVIVTGISSIVAETIVDLGVDWEHLDTLADLQSGLLVALRRLGYHIRRE